VVNTVKEDLFDVLDVKIARIVEKSLNDLEKAIEDCNDPNVIREETSSLKAVGEALNALGIGLVAHQNAARYYK
jgi:hypothetical protein